MLATGERITVSRSAMIDAMVRNGFIRIIEEYEDGQVPPETPVESPDSDEYDGPEGIPARPAKNASKQSWRDFLTANNVPFDWTLTRDELIELADMHVE